ncbi:MAG: hypothetical protein ABIP33_02645 [Pseudolysinimonas sp.]
MVSLLVDTESFLEAGTHARSVAQSVEQALSRASSGFAGSSQMAGSDHNGRTWAASYDQACGQIFTCVGQLQDAASTLSRKLSVTGYYYELTELANAGLTDVALAMPAPIMRTSCPYIPSAEGGERKFPNAGNPAFEWVAEQIANLVGDMWPDGDTGKLDHASTVWHRLADDLDDAASSFRNVTDALVGVDTPELSKAHDEIAQVRKYAKKLATACRTLGKACNDLSGQIAHVHLQTEITVGIAVAAIVVTVGAGLGLTVFTFGLSDLAAAGGVAAEVGGAVATITGFVAELASTVSVGVGLIAESAAGVIGISADLATTIGITVGDISASAVLWGAAGSVEDVVITGITQPDGDFVDAAVDGFIGGAIGGGAGAGFVKVVEVMGSSGKLAFLVRGSDAVSAGLSDDMRASILAMAKGDRPDPASYLSPEYIAQHLAKFEDGGTRFTTQDRLHTNGIGQTDGTSFLLATSEVDELVRSTNGDPRLLEQALGLPEGQLGRDAVRIDIPAPLNHGGRIPSGNEAGANDRWDPSGLLPNGNSELVIDVAGMKPGVDYYAVGIMVGG